MKWQEFKFPKTPYIFSKGVRGDKELTKQESELFLASPVIIQEKVDGNNIAIFTDSEGPHFKSRGSIITPYDTKFKNLDKWYELHYEEIKELSDKEFLLIGEWAFWNHTINYQKLPSYFIAYDIFDLEKEKFLSQKKIDELLTDTTISYNQPIYEGYIHNRSELDKLLKPSQFGAPAKEGLVLRIDDENYNIKRAKYVPKEFTNQIQKHWTPMNRNISTNKDEEWY